jgi:hypothetical protein
MAKKTKKPLLNEGTVRRMMKLAEIDSLSDQFIGQSYVTEEEDEFADDEEEVDIADDEGGDEEIEIDDVEAEVPEDEGLEGEVTITDEEAQDIIDLAAKLEDAVGGGAEDTGEEEMEMELEPASEEFPEEEPEGEEFEDEEEESPASRVYENELYEAALRGLQIDLVDDQNEKAAAVLQEVKSRIYKRVVDRLLKENKKTTSRKRRKR